jgi:hypothetical protein
LTDKGAHVAAKKIPPQGLKSLRRGGGFRRAVPGSTVANPARGGFDVSLSDGAHPGN